MGRARRYDDERKLNWKKVFAVVIAFLVIIMFFVAIRELVKDKSTTNEKLFATAYYAVYENGKWGVIDTKGNSIITPTYSEMIVIPDNTKAVFVVMEDVDYENGTFKTKVLNEKNLPIFTKYDNVEVLSNHDKDNNLWYENVLKVEKDGKYGLITLDGKEIAECSKDSIEVMTGTKAVYITTVDGKKGIINNTGKQIIEENYSAITSLTERYENGFIVKNENNKYGLINYDKSVALEEKFDGIKHVHGDNLFVVLEGKNWKVINNKEEVVLDSGFDDIKSIDGDFILFKKDNKYGVISKSGSVKIEAEYDDLTYAFGEYYIAKRDDKYGIINLEKKAKVEFKYSYIKYNSEAGFIQATNDSMESDLMDKEFKVKAQGIVSQINNEKNYIKLRVNGEYKYYNFKLEEKENTEILSTNTIFLSKKNRNYGYVNEKGIVVVDYIYEDATEQNKYGFAAVKKDGKWGVIDAKGKVVVEPIYKLENSMVIDFISEWHLAYNINANYYTK